MEQTVHITAGDGYDVTVDAGLTARCGQLLRQAHIGGKLAVVTDSHVEKLCLARVLASLKEAGYAADSFTFPAGERAKTMHTLSDILEFFARTGLDRGDCAVALGGGVTGDLTGFAAGCYMRGISYVQIPTSLLAAVDASVGGKTAIDLHTGKNMAGLFVQPKAVLCDVDVMHTLPPDTLAQGAAEAIKTGILGDEALFDLFAHGRWQERLEEVVLRCVSYKGKIVSADPHEHNVRRLLNLGHTPAHAIELCSGFSVPHGSAVAIGLCLMARAACKRGYMERDCALRIERTVASCGLPTQTAFSAQELAEAALSDKKRAGCMMTVVMPRSIGCCTLETVALSKLADLFACGMEAL